MPTPEITIEGSEELRQKFAKLDFRPALKKASMAIARELHTTLAEYPPAGPGNRRKTTYVSGGDNDWYERGYGFRWLRSDGSVGGQAVSEMLNRQWSVKQSGVGAILSNKASYSRKVHSEEEQRKIHARTGWRTDEEEIKKLIQKNIPQRITDKFILEAARKAGLV